MPEKKQKIIVLITFISIITLFFLLQDVPSTSEAPKVKGHLTDGEGSGYKAIEKAKRYHELFQCMLDHTTGQAFQDITGIVSAPPENDRELHIEGLYPDEKGGQ